MKAPTEATSKKRRRGRPKATEISVTARKQISALRTRLHLSDAVLTYRDVADQLTFRAGFKVSAATVWKFANGQEPRSPKLRRLFNLPALAPAPVCPTCGEVHVKTGRCPHAPKLPRKPRYRPTVREVRGYAALVLALLSGVNR